MQICMMLISVAMAMALTCLVMLGLTIREMKKRVEKVEGEVRHVREAGLIQKN